MLRLNLISSNKQVHIKVHPNITCIFKCAWRNKKDEDKCFLWRRKIKYKEGIFILTHGICFNLYLNSKHYLSRRPHFTATSNAVLFLHFHTNPKNNPILNKTYCMKYTCNLLKYWIKVKFMTDRCIWHFM